MSSRNGHQAFDELVREGFMEVNELGWGRIVKRPRTQRELDWLVMLVKALGAWSAATRWRIEVNTGHGPEELWFRKKPNEPREETE